MDTKQYYCTLFDSKYSPYGLSLYKSMRKFCGNFHLFVFCFDDESYRILKRLNLKEVTLVSLREFENNRLLAIKPNRSRGEYCWTCASSTIKYVLENYRVDSCTYLDADLCFFASPASLFNELGEKNVLITEHNYSREYNKNRETEKKYGRYIVQFVTVKNNKMGRHILDWWVDKCIDWCFARIEDGKYGDQKYLEEMVKLFPDDVVVSRDLRAGVAPWNATSYNFKKYGSPVFYHFHGLKLYPNGHVQLTLPAYKMNTLTKQNIYKPYLSEFIKSEHTIQAISPGIVSGYVNNYDPPQWSFQSLVSEYLNSVFASIKQCARALLFTSWFDRQYMHRNTFRTSEVLK